MKETQVYVDGANLHQSAKRLGYGIDYLRLRIWLSQKYQSRRIYLFLGYLDDHYHKFSIPEASKKEKTPDADSSA